jgi:protein-disulfide isomerase
MNLRRVFATTLVSLAISFSVAPSVSAEDFTSEQIEALVLETILKNPEVIQQAIEVLQQRQQVASDEAAATALANQRNLLENDDNAPILGNPDGDVTVVEFFDYNCPYCKQAGKTVKDLIAADPNVRVVYREWPILSEGSVFASRAALAARAQGKYEEFHWALLAQRGQLNEKSVSKIADEIGLDVKKLLTDMEDPGVTEHIETTHALARSLGFGGTPSFVVGDELVPGMVGADTLLELVNQARAANE